MHGGGAGAHGVVDVAQRSRAGSLMNERWSNWGSGGSSRAGALTPFFVHSLFCYHACAPSLVFLPLRFRLRAAQPSMKFRSHACGAPQAQAKGVQAARSPTLFHWYTSPSSNESCIKPAQQQRGRVVRCWSLVSTVQRAQVPAASPHTGQCNALASGGRARLCAQTALSCCRQRSGAVPGTQGTQDGPHPPDAARWSAPRTWT